MRIPVIDSGGVPLMPCTPAKARQLLKAGQARPKRNKLGLFYLQLTYAQEPDNQPLAVGIDPGSKWEGYSVVGNQETVLNLMAKAPTHIKEAVLVRATMRRARRHRLWRRPARFYNRRTGHKWLPPSTRSRWEAKARVVQHLLHILPLTDVAVEDVQAVTRPGKGRQWNASFSAVQVGKNHLYTHLAEMGFRLWTYEGWQTKAFREQHGLTKSSNKAQATFASHAVDAWVLAAQVTGAHAPPCTRLHYLTTIRLHRRQLHRRQLHRLQPAPGGLRKPYGGTRSLGVKRGTLVRHPKHGLVSVGGVDRKRLTISLHHYRSNKRLTQAARVSDCHILTWTPYRSYLVPAAVAQKKLKPLKRGVSSRRSKQAGFHT